MGYFTELGPFRLNDESINGNPSIPNLLYNEYTWTKLANIVFLESPAGVGFSFCNGTLGPSQSCPLWNDSIVAKDNYLILTEWFKSYPEYKNNKFYLCGESYAGIYIPTLVMQIEANSANNKYLPKLYGFAIGNGAMGIDGQGGADKDNYGNFWDVMYGHGQCSTSVYNHIQNTCGNSLYFGNETGECMFTLNGEESKLGGYNIWNIYDTCYLKNDLKNREYSELESDASDGEYKCGSQSVTSLYLNNEQVKKAINVNSDIHWVIDQGSWNWNQYTPTQTDLSGYYFKWVNKYRIMVYYGDVDAAVPYNGGERWTVNLGYPILEQWRPWTIDGKQAMAGYVQIFSTNDTKYNFTYVTVRGAGHMVPQYKPKEALKMFEIFVHDLMWPRFSTD